MRQEDGKQADPLTLYAVPDQQRRSLSHSQPQLHRLGGCGMPGTRPWGMPPPQGGGPPQAGRPRPCRQEQQLGHTCPGESGKEDFLYKGGGAGRAGALRATSGEVTSGTSFLDRSLHPFHMPSGHGPVLNTPKAISNKHSKKPGTGNET